MRGSAPPGTPVLIGAPDIDFAVAGPMARSAQDLGLAIGVLAGPDVASATGYRLALPPPRHTRLSDFRVLVLERHPMLPTSSGIRQAVHRFAEGLIAVGCKVDRQGTKVPDLLLVASTFTKMLMSFFGADMPAAAYQGAQMGASALDVSDDSPASSQLRGLVMTHRDWILAAGVLARHEWFQNAISPGIKAVASPPRRRLCWDDRNRRAQCGRRRGRALCANWPG